MFTVLSCIPIIVNDENTEKDFREWISAAEWTNYFEKSIFTPFFGIFHWSQKKGGNKREKGRKRKTAVIMIDYFFFICEFIDISLIAAGARVDNEKKNWYELFLIETKKQGERI